MFKKTERDHSLLRSVSWLVCACFIKSKSSGACSRHHHRSRFKTSMSLGKVIRALSPSGSSELKRLSLMTKEGGKSNADSMS